MKGVAAIVCIALAVICALGFFSCAFAAETRDADIAREEALARGFAGGALMCLVAAIALALR